MKTAAFPIHKTRIPNPAASFSFHPSTYSLTTAIINAQFSNHSSIPAGFKLRLKSHKGTLSPIHASEFDAPDTTQRWLLEPIGDGDTKHIGFKVEMPGAIEIVSSEVIVGRVPGKANVVIPVATVSGVHARIKKKADSLLVTDLDSTNGTFIDDQRLRPGVVTQASSGSCITFGDTHLAMFRISKIESLEANGEAEKPNVEQDTQDESSTAKGEMRKEQ